MKNLGKLIRSSTEERLNWRQELQKYLRAYRATPHEMTKHSPANLLFNGRRYKTRLPAPTSKKILLYDREVRTNDASSKETVKQDADSKSYVKELDIKVGDTVLCRQAKLNKRTTPFNREPMVVVKRKGSLVTARSATRTITRVNKKCNPSGCYSLIFMTSCHSTEHMQFPRAIRFLPAEESLHSGQRHTVFQKQMRWISLVVQLKLVFWSYFSVI